MLIDATRTCLRKTFRYGGRASRREYWGFVLTIILALVVAAGLNLLIFGPHEIVAYKLFQGEDGSAAPHLVRARRYGQGPLIGVVLALAALPLVSATWRRLHDASRPGWHLFAPWGLFVFAVFASMIWTLEAPAMPADLSEGVPEAVALPFIPEPIVDIVYTVWLGALIVTTFWLTRPSQPGPNKYGPNPQEVPK